MVDPLTSFIRTSVSQNALSGGLQQLLQSGNQRGIVQHGNDGKVFVNIKGFSLPLTTNQNVSQATLQPGQPVTIRLQNGQIIVEPVITKTTPLPEQTTETSRTISNILNQMGITTPQAQTIAQAFVQTNIPLNTAVIQELAQAFPQINPDILQSLMFLISRRLPISDSMLYWFTRMTSRRENTGKLTQAIIEDIDNLQDQLENLDDEEVQQIRSNLSGFQDQLHQQFLAFQQSNPNDLMEDLKQTVQNTLISAEAILTGNSENWTSLAETVVRLLAFLIQLQQKMDQSPHLPLLLELTQKVETLHELLASQSIQYLPPVNGQDNQAIFITIPIWKDDGKDQLELLYKPSGSNLKSGSVDLRVDMSQLGPMHIHIGWQHPYINMEIMVENGDVKDYLLENQQELKDGLTKLGFQIRQIHVKQEQIPTTLQPEFHNPLHSALSGIDVRI